MVRQAERRASGRQVAAFMTGVLLLVGLFETPFDTLAADFLSAHMVQHLAVTLVVPPLLLLGTPAWLLEPWFRSSRAVSVGRFLTRPLAAYALFNVPFTLVHLPALYELMLRNTAAHLLSHGVFLLTALLLWWPVLGPLPALPRLAYPLQMLYLLVQTVPGQFIGAFLTFAPSLLYPFYGEAARGGVSPELDQQIAGLLMWVGGGFFYLIPLGGVFFAWYNREEARTVAT